MLFCFGRVLVVECEGVFGVESCGSYVFGDWELIRVELNDF